MRDVRARVEGALVSYLPDEQTKPLRLHSAMRYAVLEGGKRIRSLLVYAAGQAVGETMRSLDPIACAIEIIHAYSLIHDDLPDMDADELRRGRATCHKKYDPGTAILAGDALQPLAFEVIVNEPGLTDRSKILIMQTLVKASGSLGMAGGQAIDLQSIGQSLTLEELKKMHIWKTGALIQAATLMGALAKPDVNPHTLDKLGDFGHHIGLAFQIQDDILDVIGDTKKLGKPQGSDRKNDKPTFVSLCGLELAKQHAHHSLQHALDTLADMPENTNHLEQLARYMVGRTN